MNFNIEEMKLTYDLFKINFQGNELYFIYDNELHLVVTKGVDYFSAWYLLMFKLRPFAENFNEYVTLFQEKKFDLHDKNFFNNALLGNLMGEIASYSTSYFMTRDELIFDAPAYGLSELDYLEKIAILKPFLASK